ncbi:hypothetical protein [Aquimarina muelleri]|uniref:Uncharacterized protein n=1 Tax=Aquimarina muelleri TaxID=279356 RepID=A0A918JXY6_9FLAO|nr:hypothetical protein [Aquimarina muelleri]MCX2764862.1 hypothetical protein [Aquimarina muelleri]GGX34276.1 hypothetical protein GCM10007384_38640 [Aquimarina muelleri]
MIIASLDDRELVVNILWSSHIELKFLNSICFVVKQDEKKLAKLRYLIEYLFAIAMKFGKIPLFLPKKRRLSLLTFLWKIKLAFYCVCIKNILKVLERESQIKKKHLKILFTPCWLMAVFPRFERKGIGGKLLLKVFGKV